jgi:leucyl-tRNA synthetase
MELLNSITAWAPVDKDAVPVGLNPAVVSEMIESLVLLMAPFAPHLGEEVWHEMGNTDSVYRAAWPAFDRTITAEDEITIAVQVNGKLRGTVTVPADADEAAVKAAAQANPKVSGQIRGMQFVKMIVVPGKLVNIVVK